MGELLGKDAAARPDDTVGVIEIELLKLVRYLETLGRRGDLYAGVDRAGYVVLRTLDRFSPTSINALAERLHLDASTVTRQVAGLESAGFVARRPDTEDRRSISVLLTPAGREAMDIVACQRRQALASLVDGWTEAERDGFGTAMLRLNLALEKKAANAAPSKRAAVSKRAGAADRDPRPGNR
jgi:DNA-binding MarR family transcriptional regulator